MNSGGSSVQVRMLLASIPEMTAAALIGVGHGNVFPNTGRKFRTFSGKVFPFRRGRGLPHWNVRFSSDCVRLSPNRRPSLADVRYRADFVRFTPESRRDSGRLRESEVDPFRTLMLLGTDLKMLRSCGPTIT